MKRHTISFQPTIKKTKSEVPPSKIRKETTIQSQIDFTKVEKELMNLFYFELFGPHTALPPNTERVIVEWILKAKERKIDLKTNQVISLARGIYLKYNKASWEETLQNVDSIWYFSFLHRHPNLNLQLIKSTPYLKEMIFYMDTIPIKVFIGKKVILQRELIEGYQKLIDKTATRVNVLGALARSLVFLGDPKLKMKVKYNKFSFPPPLGEWHVTHNSYYSGVGTFMGNINFLWSGHSNRWFPSLYFTLGLTFQQSELHSILWSAKVHQQTVHHIQPYELYCFNPINEAYKELLMYYRGKVKEEECIVQYKSSPKKEIKIEKGEPSGHVKIDKEDDFFEWEYYDWDPRDRWCIVCEEIIYEYIVRCSLCRSWFHEKCTKEKGGFKHFLCFRCNL